MSKRKSTADDFAIREALRVELAKEIGGKTRAQRIAEALVKKGESGISAAVTEIQNRLTGKPGIASPQNQFRLSEETARRLADIAAKLVGHCPKCGYTEPKREAAATETFQAYEPHPEPAKVQVQDSEPEKVVLHRQPRTLVENPDADRDHRGVWPAP